MLVRDIEALLADSFTSLSEDIPDDGDTHDLYMAARGYMWAMTRVEVEGWEDNPWRDPWVEAYRLCYEDALMEVQGIEPRYNRHDRFTKYNEVAKWAWLAAHPEYENYRRTENAAQHGRLF